MKKKKHTATSPLKERKARIARDVLSLEHENNTINEWLNKTLLEYFAADKKLDDLQVKSSNPYRLQNRVAAQDAAIHLLKNLIASIIRQSSKNLSSVQRYKKIILENLENSSREGKAGRLENNNYDKALELYLSSHPKRRSYQHFVQWYSEQKDKPWYYEPEAKGGVTPKKAMISQSSYYNKIELIKKRIKIS